LKISGKVVLERMNTVFILYRVCYSWQTGKYIHFVSTQYLVHNINKEK
jgi:hypothetical protein